MQSWRELGMEAMGAAQFLGRKYPRSCIARAYYAAYSVLTGHLSAIPGVSFVEGREGPSHADLPDLIRNHMKLDLPIKKSLVAAIRRLYQARITADYLPSSTIVESDALKALMDARLILARFDALN